MLFHGKYQRTAAFERTGVRFIERSVLKEDSVAAANRSFSAASGVPGKTNTWSRIKEWCVHAAGRHSILSALHQPVGNVRIEVGEIQRQQAASPLGQVAGIGIDLDLCCKRRIKSRLL